jgi:predicted nucleic acid-binding protein
VILVDTSVWIDHLRAGDPHLAKLLDDGRVLSHPFIIGEIALGSLRQRSVIIEALEALPAITVAEHGEVMHVIGHAGIAGTGIGYVDAHLIASVQLQPDARLWTRDKRLLEVAMRLGLASIPGC